MLDPNEKGELRLDFLVTRLWAGTIDPGMADMLSGRNVKGVVIF
jgi:Zn-dependent alcohol dehydrogenase